MFIIFSQGLSHHHSWDLWVVGDEVEAWFRFSWALIGIDALAWNKRFLQKKSSLVDLWVLSQTLQLALAFLSRWGVCTSTRFLYIYTKKVLPSSPHIAFHFVVWAICRSSMPARQTLSPLLLPGHFFLVIDIMLFNSVFPTSCQLSRNEGVAKCEIQTPFLFGEYTRNTTHMQRILWHFWAQASINFNSPSKRSLIV